MNTATMTTSRSSTASGSRTIVESSFELPDGSRIEYASTGAASEATLVFVHGWPDSWFSFAPVMESLAAQVSAISVSLPGFGGSDAIAAPATPTDLAAAVIIAMDRLGISDAVLVGHSMGTLVSQRVAEMRPDLVRGAGADRCVPQSAGRPRSTSSRVSYPVLSNRWTRTSSASSNRARSPSPFRSPCSNDSSQKACAPGRSCGSRPSRACVPIAATVPSAIRPPPC